MSTDFDIVTIKMVISLIIILGLIICLFLILKRFRLSHLSSARIPVMRILGTLNLAPKRAIALVEVCDQWLIVGIGTENVTLISKLDRPPEASGSDACIPTNGKKFHSFLQNIGFSQRDRNNLDTRKNAKA